jgi:hypothetical protein
MSHLCCANEREDFDVFWNALTEVAVVFLEIHFYEFQLTNRSGKSLQIEARNAKMFQVND